MGQRNILVGKPEGKNPLGIPGRRWHNNIKMDLKEIGWEGADWIYLDGDMDRWRGPVNKVLKLRVLSPQEGLYSVELAS